MSIHVWPIIINSSHQVNDVVPIANSSELLVPLTQADEFLTDSRALIVDVFLDVNPVKKVMRCLIWPIECLDLALCRHQHERKILLRMVD
ncbi:hypothetical protein AVT10_16070 [Sphingomonas hankookensis]|uniref:Uncharacterized protein n=1 Tax=Sphingomonas hankookensis TaxID=563996 RepID=A0ABR5YB97_9SPHN|nr:hypothetical protein AVT10_16070 [Sphingomonas hankookensis]